MTVQAGGGLNGDGPRDETKAIAAAAAPKRRRRPLRNRIRGFVQRNYFLSIIMITVSGAALLHLLRALAIAYLRTS